MKLVCLFILTMIVFSFSHPTNFFNGKWYECSKIVYDSTSVQFREEQKWCSKTKSSCIEFSVLNKAMGSDYSKCSEYDSKGNEIKGGHLGPKLFPESKEHCVDDYWKEYDSKGNVIHYIKNPGCGNPIIERWYKWFVKNNEKYICNVSSDGSPIYLE